ncbi:hypothetical protein ANCDUO_19680, partial [Ancylostoma duodenale]
GHATASVLPHTLILLGLHFVTRSDVPMVSSGREVQRCDALPSATVSVCPEKNGPPSPASMSIDDPRNISLPVKHLPQPDGFVSSLGCRECDRKETLNLPKSREHHVFRRTSAGSVPRQVLPCGPKRERPVRCPACVLRVVFLPPSLNCWCSPLRPVRAPSSSITSPSTTAEPSEPAPRAAPLRPAATGVQECTNVFQEEVVQRLEISLELEFLNF